MVYILIAKVNQFLLAWKNSKKIMSEGYKVKMYNRFWLSYIMIFQGDDWVSISSPLNLFSIERGVIWLPSIDYHLFFSFLLKEQKVEINKTAFRDIYIHLVQCPTIIDTKQKEWKREENIQSTTEKENFPNLICSGQELCECGQSTTNLYQKK